MLQCYIMRRYCLFIIFAAIFLCGCESGNGVVEYVYHNESPLTVVTTVTEVPADTYSEYMETYTPATTTGTDVYYYRGTQEWNHNMEIAPKPERPDMIDRDMPQADTAMSMDTAPKAEKPAAETTTADGNEGEQSEETSVGETTVPETAMELPSPDTSHIFTAAPDTAPTKPTITGTASVTDTDTITE